MRKVFYITCALALTTVVVSCQNEERGYDVQEQPTAEFRNVCRTAFLDISTLGVSNSGKGNGPRKSAPAKLDSTQTVYVKPSFGQGTAADLQPYTGKTLKDFVDYLELMSATHSMYNDGTAVDSTQVSVTEAKEKLKPLVSESYKYLKKFGFSEAEIRSMIADNHADEESLVLLMLTMKEYEGNVTSGFFSPPKPGNNGKPAENSSFDYKRAAWCALEIIGVNIVETLIDEGAEKLTKKAIIKLFKKVAVRTVGPVGILFTAYDWARCMNYI